MIFFKHRNGVRVGRDEDGRTFTLRYFLFHFALLHYFPIKLNATIANRNNGDDTIVYVVHQSHPNFPTTDINAEFSRQGRTIPLTTHELSELCRVYITDVLRKISRLGVKKYHEALLAAARAENLEVINQFLSTHGGIPTEAHLRTAQKLKNPGASIQKRTADEISDDSEEEASASNQAIHEEPPQKRRYPLRSNSGNLALLDVVADSEDRSTSTSERSVEESSTPPQSELDILNAAMPRTASRSPSPTLFFPFWKSMESMHRASPVNLVNPDCKWPEAPSDDDETFVRTYRR